MGLTIRDKYLWSQRGCDVKVCRTENEGENLGRGSTVVCAE